MRRRHTAVVLLASRAIMRLEEHGRPIDGRRHFLWWTVTAAETRCDNDGDKERVDADDSTRSRSVSVVARRIDVGQFDTTTNTSNGDRSSTRAFLCQANVRLGVLGYITNPHGRRTSMTGRTTPVPISGEA